MEEKGIERQSRTGRQRDWAKKAEEQVREQEREARRRMNLRKQTPKTDEDENRTEG